LTSVEALGWWLAGRPQTEAREPFIETRIPLDRETSERLLYLSKRFAIPKRTLLRELVRAAVDDVFAVIPSDQPLARLVCDPGDSRVTPEGAQWFDPQRVKEGENREELQVLKFGGLDEGLFDEETAKRLWRAIRKDVELEDRGGDEPG
jgi:predicted DNA-binding protein